jgi:hypothetical protein
MKTFELPLAPTAAGLASWRANAVSRQTVRRKGL